MLKSRFLKHYKPKIHFLLNFSATIGYVGPIYLGGLLLNGDEDGKVSTYATTHIIHPSFNADNYNYNIALLLLHEPLSFNGNICMYIQGVS